MYRRVIAFKFCLHQHLQHSEIELPKLCATEMAAPSVSLSPAFNSGLLGVESSIFLTGGGLSLCAIVITSQPISVVSSHERSYEYELKFVSKAIYSLDIRSSVTVRVSWVHRTVIIHASNVAVRCSIYILPPGSVLSIAGRGNVFYISLSGPR